MQVIIKHLELCNFGMFRTLNVDFDEKVTNIMGRNGSGKSTIANAIQWLFTGKSADGRSQFALKTHDENGVEIPKVDHFVRAEVTLNGEPYELKKGITEKWTKVKGENRETMANQTYYSVNAEPMKKSEWDEFMTKISPETVFKAVTNPFFFVSLDWKTQRDFLYKMVGGVRQDEIVAGDTTFDPLLKELENQSITDILASYGYQIKELKKKLDLIPVRIEEQNKALPDKQDWDTIRKQVSEKVRELQGLQNKLAELRRNPSDTLHQELAQKLSSINSQMFSVKEKIKSDYEQRRIVQNAAVNDVRKRITQNENTIADLNAKIDGLEALVKRANQAKNAANVEKQRIEAEFDKLRDTHLEVPENIDFCPTCGQMLPQDQIEQKREQLQENFNKQKVDKANDLKVRYKDAKADIAKAEDTANHYFSEETSVKTQIGKLQSDIDTDKELLKTEQDKLSAILPPEDTLPNDPEYVKLQKEHDDISSQIDNLSQSVTDTTTALIEETKTKISSLNDEISMLHDTLAEEKQYGKIQNNIADINKEQAGISTKITKLEQMMDIATEYSNRQGRILESKVNAKFKFVKWKMFKDYLNGAKEDWCECYVNGTAYHDCLNTSSKTNAGLDIVNTLSEVYRAWLPVICDNAEACNSLLPTKAQQIRLYVTTDDKLKVNEN